MQNDSQKVDKDNALNTFMAKPEIFADLFNAYLYDGQQVIVPENLQPADRLLSEVIGNDNGLVKLTRFRDVFKVYQDQNASYVLLGIENQMAIHYAMPLRNMIYDALSLLAEQRQISAQHVALKDLVQPDEYLSRFAKKDRLGPVISLVVYYGTKPWDGPLTLHDMISFPNEELRRFMPDYFINLVIPAKMWEEHRSSLKTELNTVFGCIRFSDNDKALETYIINQPRCKEMSVEAVQAINACTHANIKIEQTGGSINMCQAIIDMKQHAYDKGYQDACQAITDMKQHAYDKGYQDACQVKQQAYENAFQKGEESGFQKGEESHISKMALRMLDAEYDMQEISKLMGISAQEIEKIIQAHQGK